VIWTSGATEANNLAILGARASTAVAAGTWITSRTEHAAVLDPCRQLEREGFAVTYLRPDPTASSSPSRSLPRCSRTR
jgi:cysteine desulfurase